MFHRSTRGCSSVFALALGVASPAAAAIDLVGATNATFAWEPASGPVSGYVVYQLCDTTGQTQKSSVTTNRVTLTPQACAAFSLQVAAYGVEGQAQTGPLSDRSELVRFLPAAPPPDPEPTPDPGAGGEAPGAPPATPSDLDGDGRADVLLHHPSDGALLLCSLFKSRLLSVTSLPAFPVEARVVGSGDYDGDGFLDLLGVDRGQVFVWLMRGATPTGGGSVGAPLAAGESVEGSGDYDGDGVSDVLIRRPGVGSIDVWSMRGGAVEASATLAPDPGPSWRIVGSGDHDADGLADVLWQNASDGRLALWRSLARASFETRALPPAVDAGWQGVAVADFDADGASDVMWRKLATGELALSLFRGGVVAETRALATAATRREIVGTGDFDENGSPDVLARFVHKASLKLFRMNDATIVARDGIANLDPSWLPVALGAESPSGQRWR
jgi:hypothetical protein